MGGYSFSWPNVSVQSDFCFAPHAALPQAHFILSLVDLIEHAQLSSFFLGSHMEESLHGPSGSSESESTVLAETVTS